MILNSEVLAAFVVWLEVAGNKEKAAELASFIVSEERFTYHVRRDTQSLYDALADDYPQAIERGKQAEVDEIIEEILTDYSHE